MKKLSKFQMVMLVISIICILLFLLWMDEEGILELLSLVLGLLGFSFGALFSIDLLKNNKKYELNRAKKTRNKSRFRPSKLKDNLLALEERSNSYSFKPTYKLNCSDHNTFKIEVYAIPEKSIFGAVTLVSKNDGVSIHCTCNECGKEFEIFNSTKDGYNGYLCTDKRIDFEKEEFYCVKCHKNDFTIEIEYSYDNDKEMVKEIKETMEEVKKEDITNTFGWISITVKCNHCGKVYKHIFDYECM